MSCKLLYRHPRGGAMCMVVGGRCPQRSSRGHTDYIGKKVKLIEKRWSALKQIFRVPSTLFGNHNERLLKNFLVVFLVRENGERSEEEEGLHRKVGKIVVGLGE